MSAPEISDGAEYFAPDFVEGKLYDSGWDQKTWLAIWAVFGGVLVFAGNSLIAKGLGLLFVGIGFVGFLTFNEGPGYMMPLDWLLSRKVRRYGGFIDPNQSVKRVGAIRAQVGRLLVSMYLGIEDPKNRLAAVHDRPMPTGLITPIDYRRVSIVIRFDGSKIPAKDWNGRMTAEQRVVDVLSEAAAMVEYQKVGLTIAPFVGARPHDLHPGLRRLADEELHPDFIRPPKGTMESRGAEMLDARIRKLGQAGADTFNGYIITIDTPQAWIDALRSGGEIPGELVHDSALAMMAEHVVQGLKNIGLTGVRCLNILELDEFVRLMREVTNAGVLHSWLADRRERFEKMSLDEIIAELQESTPWPTQLIRLGEDYLFMDGTYFKVYRTLRYGGSRRFRPGSMLPLQFPSRSRWNTTTLCGFVVDPEVEEEHLTRSIVWGRAVQHGKRDRYLSLRERDDLGRNEAQQGRLYRAGAPVFKFNRYVLVAAPTRVALARSGIATFGGHLLRGIVLAPIRWEARQIRAFTAVLLGDDS